MKKTIGVILLAIFTLLVIIIFSIIYITKLKVTDVGEYENENNHYMVLFQAIGEPEWPFGRTKVRVTLLDSQKKKVETFEEYLQDDGAIAREENIEVEWQEEEVKITLKGGEQEDSIHKIKYKSGWNNF